MPQVRHKLVAVLSSRSRASMSCSVVLKVTLLALALCSPLLVSAGKDYYDVLSLPRSANEQQIKRAYRKLALQYHPDKVTGNEAEKEDAAKRFAEINNAYEALSDPEKRKIYDQHGEEGLKQQQQQGGQQGGGNIFDMFFGGFGGFGRQEQEEEQIRKGHDVYVDLLVTLRDLYVGKELQVTRDKAVIKPAPGKRQCKCKQKLQTRQLGPGMFQQYQTQVCEECPNVKLEREQEVLTVHVQPGMEAGQHITFFEEGEPLTDGEPGDLKFVIKVVPDSRWERRGKDLLINETITLADALTGFSFNVHHLDGHTVQLSSSGVTQYDDWVAIPGEGMPIKDNEHRRGDLWVKYTVKFPTHLTEEQKAAVKKLFPETRTER